MINKHSREKKSHDWLRSGRGVQPVEGTASKIKTSKWAERGPLENPAMIGRHRCRKYRLNTKQHQHGHTSSSGSRRKYIKGPTLWKKMIFPVFPDTTYFQKIRAKSRSRGNEPSVTSPRAQKPGLTPSQVLATPLQDHLGFRPPSKQAGGCKPRAK